MITPLRRAPAPPPCGSRRFGPVGAALEHGRARDQHIGAGRTTRGAVSGVMPPSTSMSIGRPPTSARDSADLVHRRRDELLAAEAGIDRHDQHEIDQVDDVLDRSTPACAGFMVTPAFLPSARIACSERCRCGPASTCTVMMSEPALAKASRCGSHGAIIRCTSSVFLVMRAQRLHHVGAEGDVRHEMPVHHVEMDPVGAGGLDRAHLLAQLGEVGGQDRRRDEERAGHDGLHDAVRVTRAERAGNAAAASRAPAFNDGASRCASGLSRCGSR